MAIRANIIFILQGVFSGANELNIFMSINTYPSSFLVALPFIT